MTMMPGAVAQMSPPMMQSAPPPQIPNRPMGGISAVAGGVTSAGAAVSPTNNTAPMMMAGGVPMDAEKMVKKLQRAIEVSRSKLKNFRNQRLEMLKQYAGKRYDYSDGMQKAEPINMIFQAVQSLVPSLVYNNPQVKIDTENLQLRQFAKVFELANDHLIKRIDLRDTLRAVLVDALFGVGIIKCGLTFGNEVQIDGITHDIGQPFADRVSLDDFVIDPAARNMDEYVFIGNRYRLPLEYVQECGLYENTDKLKAKYQDYGDNRRAETLSNGQSGDSEIYELVEYVELYDLYIPQDNVTITIPCNASEGTSALRVVPWEGPRRGPYELLYFHYMPDNLMPISPASVWMDIHEMINTQARKMKRQAERQKSVLAYQSTAAKDAQNIVEGGDGDTIQVDHIDGVREMNFGGAEDVGYKWLAALKGIFSDISANSDLLGGLGTPNTSTATEGSILNANAQTVLGDKKEQMYEFVSRIVEKLAWFLWTDPLIELQLARRDPQNGDVQETFAADAKEGDFFDYAFAIVPLSMQRQDPSLRAQKVQNFFTQFWLPTAQMAMAQGYIPNIIEAAKMLARELDLRGIDQLYSSQNPQALQALVPPVNGLMQQMQPGKGIPTPPASPTQGASLDNLAAILSSARGNQFVEGNDGNGGGNPANSYGTN